MPTPDEFIADLPLPLRKRAAQLRTLVFELAPHAAERVTWDAISLYDPDRGGPIKGNICQIVHRDGALRLDFPLGSLMDDPNGVLQAQNKRAGKRYVPIGTTTPSLTVIRGLIRASLDRPDKPKRMKPTDGSS
ncbi:MAG: DUF1801 domain-containing protein [Planctomycetota bacterium]